jgi:hypothetical protein
VSDSFSKKANAYLETDSRDLQWVFSKLKQLDELNRKVSQYLDANIRNYCQVANLKDGHLMLVTANASIATQIRFQTVDLLKKFKQDPLLQKIQAIHCKVRPPLTWPATSQAFIVPLKKMKPLSHETAEFVREIAESLEDPQLKEVMKRIAGRTENNEKERENS